MKSTTSALLAAALAAAFVAVISAAAVAGPGTDLLFATPHLEPLPPATTVTYRRDKRVGTATTAEGERIDLAVVEATDGARRVDVVIDPEGRALRYDRFDGVPGNPMLMIFLEGVVKSVRTETGGSPFYLRNRIKEALNTGLSRDEEAGVVRLTATPFAGDRNAARLGPFAALELTFIVDRSAPGMLTRMTAAAPPGDTVIYHEEIRLD